VWPRDSRCGQIVRRHRLDSQPPAARRERRREHVFGEAVTRQEPI